MKEELNKLVEQREQLLRLRKDKSIMVGITFNTVAGDIKYENPQIAVLLLDYFISDIQKRITYLMKDEKSSKI